MDRYPRNLKSSDVLKGMGIEDNPKDGFSGFFTFEDLKKALEDDFLDADRGSTDNRKGWNVSEKINGWTHYLCY